jgi:hypothetical protein
MTWESSNYFHGREIIPRWFNLIYIAHPKLAAHTPLCQTRPRSLHACGQGRQSTTRLVGLARYHRPSLKDERSTGGELVPQACITRRKSLLRGAIRTRIRLRLVRQVSTWIQIPLTGKYHIWLRRGLAHPTPDPRGNTATGTHFLSPTSSLSLQRLWGVGAARRLAGHRDDVQSGTQSFRHHCRR